MPIYEIPEHADHFEIVRSKDGSYAVVSETGGYLDHGAALARELGIPCVVGCRDAWSVLVDGMIVSVDGDGGVVSLT